ncbi:MAG: MBOAT family O-acyltransferase [Spirochaetota bacterium]
MNKTHKHFLYFLSSFVLTLAVIPAYFSCIGFENTYLQIPQYKDYLPESAKAILFPPPPQYKPLVDPARNQEDTDYLKIGTKHSYFKNFFEKLRTLEREKNTVVKIIHYGDSLVANDYVTLDFKRNFQKRFGDGGRGLVPVVKSIKITGRNVLEHTNATSSRDFRWDAVEPHRGLKQGYTNPNLGFLGETYIPRRDGSRTRHKLYKGAQAWDKIRVFLRSPQDLTTKAKLTFQDRNTENKVIHRTTTLPAAKCKELTFSGNSSKDISVAFSEISSPPPFLDGIALETKFGISYTSVSHVSMETNDRMTIPDDNFSCGMQLYRPDLIVYQFGVNEAQHMWVFSKRKVEVFKANIKAVVARVKQVSPQTDVLIISPIERIRKNRFGRVITMPEMMDLRRIQREVAEELQVGFYDTYLAMGGKGTNDRFFYKRYIMPDRIHLRRPGGKMVAKQVVGDILLAYDDYKGIKKKELTAKKKQLAEELEKQKNREVNFNSPAYAFFLLGIFICLAFLPRFHGGKLFLLLLASYYFYTSWNPSYLFLILLSTCIDYATSLQIQSLQMQGKRGTSYLFLSLFCNLALLFFFKYFHFLHDLLTQIKLNGSYLSGLPQRFTFPWTINGEIKSISMQNLTLPVGISFYTFQTMSYTIDVWRKVIPAESSFLKFSLYVSFFPQLVAGPIVRAADFLSKLKDRLEHFRLNPYLFSTAIFLILSGLIKKNFADWIAGNLVDGVFHNPDLYSSLDILFAIYGYGFQIFGDFSGYTDIAIGSAMLLGFSLTENFHRPYLSSSITEFWQRWHISLGKWFLQYLYIPLGGNRSWVYRNLFITMFLCGLWHGAGLQFVIWGVLHGLFLAFERITGLHKTPEQPILRVVKIVITFHIVLFAWIIFRSENWTNFADVLTALWKNNGQPTSQVKVFFTILLCYMGCFLPTQYWKKLKNHWNASHPACLGVAAGIVSILLFNLKIADLKPFIYFQF